MNKQGEIEMDNLEVKLQHFEDHIDDNTNKMIAWIKDQYTRSKADGVILGMSGGLDCCVVGALVKKANIPLKMISIPRGNSMQFGAMNDVRLFSETFSIPYDIIPMDSIVNMFETTISPFIPDSVNPINKDMANANIGPILRMGILSTIGQSINFIMIGTGNLTERTMGYFTKRGDGLSDFNPLGELTKSEVRILAKHLGIPTRIIEKAPSADLWEGQSDEEEMGVSIQDIDRYILTNEGDKDIVDKIKSTNQRIQHKLKPIPIFPRTLLK